MRGTKARRHAGTKGARSLFDQALWGAFAVMLGLAVSLPWLMTLTGCNLGSGPLVQVVLDFGRDEGTQGRRDAGKTKDAAEEQGAEGTPSSAPAVSPADAKRAEIEGWLEELNP